MYVATTPLVFDVLGTPFSDTVWGCQMIGLYASFIQSSYLLILVFEHVTLFIISKSGVLMRSSDGLLKNDCFEPEDVGGDWENNSQLEVGGGSSI